jgi:hypothetical protein
MSEQVGNARERCVNTQAEHEGGKSGWHVEGKKKEGEQKERS